MWELGFRVEDFGYRVGCTVQGFEGLGGKGLKGGF